MSRIILGFCSSVVVCNQPCALEDAVKVHQVCSTSEEPFGEPPGTFSSETAGGLLQWKVFRNARCTFVTKRLLRDSLYVERPYVMKRRAFFGGALSGAIVGSSIP
jgi:hypothetical protein